MSYDINKDLIYQNGQKIVLAIIVLVVVVTIGYTVSFVIKRIGRTKSVQANRVYKLLAGSINTVIAFVGIISVLGTLGINISAMVASLGLTGFAVGIALKDAVSNLVAGVLIVIYKPFDINEQVEVLGIKGMVVDINLRYVTIEQEGIQTLIPNGSFSTNIIKKSL